MTKHKYYDEDSPQRHSYFENQFFRLAGINQLTEINDFNSFKKVLGEAYSRDASLSAYFDNMSENALIMFYDRAKIQSIVKGNVNTVVKRVPVKVEQVNKHNREYFRGYRKGKPTLGYKTTAMFKGKRRVVYRDSKGRFIKVA